MMSSEDLCAVGSDMQGDVVPEQSPRPMMPEYVKEGGVVRMVGKDTGILSAGTIQDINGTQLTLHFPHQKPEILNWKEDAGRLRKHTSQHELAPREQSEPELTPQSVAVTTPPGWLEQVVLGTAIWVKERGVLEVLENDPYDGCFTVIDGTKVKYEAVQEVVTITADAAGAASSASDAATSATRRTSRTRPPSGRNRSTSVGRSPTGRKRSSSARNRLPVVAGSVSPSVENGPPPAKKGLEPPDNTLPVNKSPALSDATPPRCRSESSSSSPSSSSASESSSEEEATSDSDDDRGRSQ